MLDERLIGYWSDKHVYMGIMEAADIAFRSDGTGWTFWTRDGGSFSVTRFDWHTDASRLTLNMQEHLYGDRQPYGATPSLTAAVAARISLATSVLPLCYRKCYGCPEEAVDLDAP
ncbi:MAG: hypothetical protein M3Z75_00790 [Actinomycetota bacterium]|nr:hypothetical protein [Actinomycetota bacterium]